MHHTNGTVTANINGREIVRRYMGLHNRKKIIEDFMLLRLSDKECYYTIRPDNENKPKYIPVKERKVKIYGQTSQLALANQVRQLYIPFHSRFGMRGLTKMFGVRYHVIVRILQGYEMF